MQTISLKSGSPDTVIPLLKNAIDREKRILAESLRVTREKVNKLAKDLAVDIDKLMMGEVKHTASNDMQLLELEGEIEILRYLETEIKELESVEICG
jgi:enhancing lycopene biosynthesis protein 2